MTIQCSMLVFILCSTRYGYDFNIYGVQTTEMDHPQLTGSMIHVGNRPEGLLAPNGHNTRDVKQIPLLTTSPHREIEEEKIVKVS